MMNEATPKPGDDRLRLPNGTVLDRDYIVEGEIGSGGFGITYKGRDQKLGLPVAIKEYFPVSIGNRDNTMSVHPMSRAQGDVFKWGREGFIKEAQMLAGLKHPGIVRVLRYFEANNTAYMVLEFEAGQSFGRWLEGLGRPPTQAELDRITMAMCEALALVHAGNLVHRDIAPDNIIIRPDGHPVLLDFGAARYAVADHSRAAERSLHTSTYAVVKLHYSPFEQRSTDTRHRGPWSDVYALGATLYRAVTGKPPIDAVDRISAGEDSLPPAVTVAKGVFRAGFLAAIDQALKLNRQDRLPDIAAFRAAAFQGTASVAPTEPERVRDDDVRKVSSPSEFGRLPDARPPASPPPTRGVPMAAMAAGVAILLGGTALMVSLARQSATVVTPDPPRPPVGDTGGPTPEEIERRRRLAAERLANEEELRRQRLEIERLQKEAARAKDEAERAQRQRQLDIAEQQRREAEQRRRDIERQQESLPAQPAAPQPQAVPSGPSLWTHNTSTMRLVADGSDRRFYYIRPRAGLVAIGVRPGALLFDGTKSGDAYEGTARIFAKNCQPSTYRVSGSVSADQRRIEMRGQRPHVDERTCRVLRYSEDILIFDFVRRE